jgi:protein MpaA
LDLLDFRSVMGREISVFIYGNDGPITLVIGGIHGDEPGGVVLAEEFIHRLQTNSIKNLAGRIVVIPRANPDGLIAGTRVNARGIDINRNFPTRDFKQGYFTQSCNPGKQAGSEPETRGILHIAEVFKPKLILAFHAALGCVNYDGPGDAIAKVISLENGLPVRQDLGYPTPGSLGAYFGVERDIPVITWELLDYDQQWERHGKAIITAIGMNQG